MSQRTKKPSLYMTMVLEKESKKVEKAWNFWDQGWLKLARAIAERCFCYVCNSI